MARRLLPRCSQRRRQDRLPSVRSETAALAPVRANGNERLDFRQRDRQQRQLHRFGTPFRA